ncbi:MAG: cupredoxin domain-containing protein [Chloroflexota bacterium]|nr:cupredoxin domain-containing protein [Chloroflexota bacterium]
MTRSIRAISALFGIAALLAACSPAATAAPAAPAAAAVNIDIQGFRFPANTDVAKGTKVTWTNKDSTGHTVSSGTPPNKDGKFDGQVAAGGTFSFTFTDTGTFTYFCSIHTTMTGTVTVR